MTVNSGPLPPLGSAPFVEPNSLVLSRMGLQTLQSIVNAVMALQAQTLPTAASSSYANDAAAAVGGVPIDGYYRNGSVVQVRVV